MFTDMVGYTASTQTDEARTLEMLRSQEELVRPLLDFHHGREIKSTGDGFLVEFDSALKATECALDIQRQFHDRAPPGIAGPMRLRIGIHLGDVVERGTDILGDAVNIAARIEPVAEPGGICVSGAVRDQVWNKVPVPLEKLPTTALKGLQVALEIYRVVLPWTAGESRPANLGPAGLAVLPFANISPDPKDEYFADGLTEELITVLSQLAGLRVIARTSVTPYKSTTKGVSQIGAELGVSSILEGSVRKAGNRLRITAQLIDVGSQGHVWANTYDRELDDVFALQSEMAKQVAEALKVRLVIGEVDRLDRRPLPRPESYLEYLKGRTSLQRLDQASLRAAREHFERAVALDERNALAHAGLADAERILGGVYRHVPQEQWEATSREHAARAIELDPNLAEAHTSLALAFWDDYDYPNAEKEIELAIALNPSLAWARGVHADMLADLARVDDALREFAVAEQLDPLSSFVLGEQFNLLLDVRGPDEAEPLLERIGRADGRGLVYHLARSSLCFNRGDLPAFREEVNHLNELLPGQPEVAVAYAIYAAATGESERARELLKPIEGLAADVRPDGGLASAYARLGDLDACFRWLDAAFEAKKISVRSWRLSPRLSRVREDPRFPALLRKMNLA